MAGSRGDSSARYKLCFTSCTEAAELCSALPNVVYGAGDAGNSGIAQSGNDSSSVPRAAHTDTRAAHSDCMVAELMSGVGPSRPWNEDQEA